MGPLPRLQPALRKWATVVCARGTPLQTRRGSSHLRTVSDVASGGTPGTVGTGETPSLSAGPASAEFPRTVRRALQRPWPGRRGRGAGVLQVWGHDPGQRCQGAPGPTCLLRCRPLLCTEAPHGLEAALPRASGHCCPPCAPSALPNIISEPDHGKARMATLQARGRGLAVVTRQPVCTGPERGRRPGPTLCVPEDALQQQGVLGQPLHLRGDHVLQLQAAAPRAALGLLRGQPS